MDATFLARLQFAITIGFHFIFPPITIGLAWLLVVVEWLGWKKRDEIYQRLGRFFAKLLALTFAVGVATGIVMEFQFGTNWAEYSKFVGDIFGAPLAAEGIFAFFLESAFLGLYLFGRSRVSKGVHWFSILMVAVGSTISAFWIIVANSWQQTPAGFTINDTLGRAELTSFFDAVFNPSTIWRFLHTMLAALVTGCFFMGGISAILLLKNKGVDLARRALPISLTIGFFAALFVAFPIGHEHGQQVAHTQPEKFAAFEGIYTSRTGAPLVLFALVSPAEPELKAKIEIPKMLSYLTFGDFDAPVKGLNEFPADEVPKGAELWFAFVSFHNMVILGNYFIMMTALGLFLLWRKRLFDMKLYLKLLAISIPLPIAACEFGWVAAEVGRQPWIVYKMLRTSEAASAAVSSSEILFSIILFTSIYIALGVLYIYLIAHKLKTAPELAGPAKEVA
ncbi:MAG: cytochrome ubiquinol oxidase subunit I [Candidatus Latescibacterota bacterium]